MVHTMYQRALKADFVIYILKNTLNTVAIASSCICTFSLQAQNPTVSTAHDSAITQPLYGSLYLGVQAGLLLSLGTRIRYMHAPRAIPSWYVDAEADVGFWSELRAGAGTFLTKHWYVGTKAGVSFAWETAAYKTIGMEIGYAIPFGNTASSVLLIDCGVAFVLESMQVGPSPPDRPIAIPMNLRFCYQGKMF